MARVVIPNPTNPDINGDGKVTLGELNAATIMTILLLTTALNVTVQPLGFALFESWPWLAVGGVLTGLSILTGCALGIWRMTRYERGEKLFLDERYRQWKLEDEERARLFGKTDEVQESRINQAKLEYALRQMLRSYYTTGTYARGKVEGVTETQWNMANELLKSCGLRRGRKQELEAETFNEAWGVYVDWLGRNMTRKVTSDGDLIAF